jgi:uncharacterized protein YjbJ (UPF0337 family)
MSNHTAEDLQGRLKKAAGDLTGNEKLKREGEIDQASAATKKAIDEVADGIKNAVNPKH